MKIKGIAKEPISSRVGIFVRFLLPIVWALSAATAQAQTLVSISVTPATASVPSGLTQQFTATGTYSNGTFQNITGSVTWSSSSTTVASITSGGLATGLALGTATIKATSGSISNSATITVTASGLVGYWTFNDGSGTTADDSSGNGYNATLHNGVTWVAGKTGDAVSANGTNQYVTIPTIDLSSNKAVTLTMWVNRTYSTTAEHMLFERSPNYTTVTNGFALFADDISCKGINAALLGNVGYSSACYTQPSSGVWHHLAVVYDKSQAGTNAVNLYIDGVLQTPSSRPQTTTNTNQFGSRASWLFSRDGSSDFSAGEVDDLRLYDETLTAAQIQQIYQIGKANLVSLSVTPANGSIAKGKTQQFTATGTYSDGSTQNLTSSVTWLSSATSVATITSAGLATGVATGSATIEAELGAITGSTGLTVSPPVLVSIAVTPVDPSISVGATEQFTATGTYSDGSTANLTSSVTWSSSSTATATITTGGLATGVAMGLSTIQATSGSD